MKPVFIFFVSLLITLNGHAVATADKSGINSIKVAHELAYVDIERALHVLHNVANEELSSDVKIQYALADLRLTIVSGKFDEAQRKVDEMKSMAMPDKYLAQYYQYAIKLSQILEDYVQAFQYLNYVDQLAEEEISLVDWVNILLVAADLNIEAGTLKTSKYWLDKAQKIADKTDDYAIKCNVSSSYAYWLNSQEKYAEFSKLQKQATEVCQMANDVWVLRMFKVIESFKLKQQGDYQGQERALLDAIALMEDAQGEFNYQQTQLLLAESYINQGKLSQGQLLVTKLYDVILAYDLANDLATLHRLKSLIAKAKGNYHLAVDELNEAVMLQERYYQAVNENQLVHLNAQFTSANNKLQNELNSLVEQRIEIDESVIQIKALLIYAIACLTLVGVIVATSIYMRRQYLSVITVDKHDALTGVLTQQGGESELENYSKLNNLQNSNVSMALISIDELAMLKHSFSVDKADRVLAITAAKLTELKNETDILFRYDDDTFALIIFQRAFEDTVTYLKRVSRPFSPKTIARLKEQTLHLSVIYTDVSMIEMLDSDTLNATLNDLLSASSQARCDEQGYVVRFDN